MILGPSGVAFAHHPSVVSNLPTYDQPLTRARLEPASKTRLLNLGGSFSYALFSRTLQGQEPLAGDQLGQVSVHTLIPQLTLSPTTTTRISLAAPVGGVTTRASNQTRESSLGPADLQLRLSQDLVERPATLPLHGIRLGSYASLTLPSGKYDRDRDLSTGTVPRTPTTRTGLLSYDTRASLGAGVVSAGGGLELAWQLTGVLELLGEAGVTGPVTDTADGIRWGKDLLVSITTSWHFIPDWLRLLAGLDYRFHGTDELPLADTRARTGGRTAVGVRAGVSQALSEGSHCFLMGHVPVWQRVDGIQLVETFSTSAGCSLALDP